MDSIKRSIAKSISYRSMGAVVTASVAWVITHEPVLSIGIGLADTFVKLFAYYAHERVWNRIDFGRKKSPPGEDYII